MKRYVGLIGLVLLVVGYVGGLGVAANSVGKNIFSGTPDEIKQSVDKLKWWWEPIHQISARIPNQELKALDELVLGLPKIIGIQDGSRHYVVLFQNNMELRPTGGFLGSYAEVWFEQGKLNKFLIQDIYVPDGQIKGYVVEPEPIKKYLFNEDRPGWRLRDANWHPDFSEATKAIDWFFIEGGLEPVDGYIAVDLVPIVDLLRLTGGVEVPDYSLTVTADNFYQEAQRHAEEGFFPGSTQKQNFLESVGKQLFSRLLEGKIEPEKIPKLVYENLSRKHILVSIPDALSNEWQMMGWDGSLAEATSDYLMVNEANVGSSKANCCIDRSIEGNIVVSEQSIDHGLTILYVNNNPPTPTPPEQWGGGYKDYLRIIVPDSAVLESVKIDDQPVEQNEIDTETWGSKKSFGWLVLTEGGGERSVVTVNYKIPSSALIPPYSLYWQKQPGVDGWPMTITLDKNNHLQTTKKVLDIDWLFE